MAFKLALYFKDDLLTRVRGTTCEKFEKSTKKLWSFATRSFIHGKSGDELNGR
jgi:hypothetical protein